MSTRAAIPFGALALGALPGWATAGSGGYLAYAGRGGQPGDVDYSSPIGMAQAGDPTAHIAGYPFEADVRHVIALRAVSDAGVEEPNETCWTTIVIDGQGGLAAGRPAAPRSAVASQAAGGLIRVRIVYDRLDERAEAATLQVAALVGDGPDWSDILGQADLAAAQRTEATIAVGPFAEGRSAILAVRAVTAGGIAGPHVWCLPVAPDATAPDAPESLIAEGLP